MQTGVANHSVKAKGRPYPWSGERRPKRDLVQDADTVEGEEYERCLADNALALQSAPETAIVAVVAVVPHDEVLARFQGERPVDGEPGRRGLVLVHGILDIGFVQRLAVDIDLGLGAISALFDLDGVARHADQPLDKDILLGRLPMRRTILIRFWGSFEDDDVQALWVAHTKGQFVDEDMVMYGVFVYIFAILIHGSGIMPQ